MDEREKIEYAKTYIDKMARGINPLDDSDIPANDLLNNVRISRCLFYVSDLLGKAISDMSRGKASKSKAKKFIWRSEFAESFKISAEPVFMKYIVENFDALNVEDGVKFPRVALSRWLIGNGYIEEVEKNGRNYKFPTQKGLDSGFISVVLNDYGREFYALMYSAAAQKLIVDSASEILGVYYDEKERAVKERSAAKVAAKRIVADGENRRFENQGLPWSKADDDKLKEMFEDGLTVGEMMNELKRSSGGIKSRLGMLGLIDSLGGAV